MQDKRLLTKFIVVFLRAASFPCDPFYAPVDMTDNDEGWAQHWPVIELIDETVAVKPPHLLRTILYILECVAETKAGVL